MYWFLFKQLGKKIMTLPPKFHNFWGYWLQEVLRWL